MEITTDVISNVWSQRGAIGLLFLGLVSVIIYGYKLFVNVLEEHKQERSENTTLIEGLTRRYETITIDLTKALTELSTVIKINQK